MTENEKSYDSEFEVLSRFGIWLQTDAKINAHNAQGFNWTMGHNLFSDLTSDEWMSMYLMPSRSSYSEEFEQ
jgi:hypothetical protein